MFVEKNPQMMPPHNTEAERAVLDLILMHANEGNNATFEKVAAIIQPSDFYHYAYQVVFEVMCKIVSRGGAPDHIAVGDELARMDLDKKVENAIYDLGGVTRTKKSILYYAKTIKEMSLCRSMEQNHADVVALAHQGKYDEAQELVAKFAYEERLRVDGDGLQPTRSLSAGFMARLDALHAHKRKITGVPTGFRDLDRMTGGLQKSDLIVLAARPGIGKSSMAASIARHAALAHAKTIALFSLEMSKEQVYQRFIAMGAEVDQQHLRTGWIEDDEWERIIEEMQRLDEASIYIDDTAGITCLEMRQRLRDLAIMGQPPDLIIVDYLQLMRPQNSEKKENRVQAIGEISGDLKGLARELNVPVLALAQLSRAVESRQSKVPQLSDLRESGAIENDADIVMFIYRDEVYNPDSERRGQADIIVAKHRNGPDGEVVVCFKKSHTAFEDIERAEPEEDTEDE